MVAQWSNQYSATLFCISQPFLKILFLLNSTSLCTFSLEHARCTWSKWYSAPLSVFLNRFSNSLLKFVELVSFFCIFNRLSKFLGNLLKIPKNCEITLQIAEKTLKGAKIEKSILCCNIHTIPNIIFMKFAENNEKNVKNSGIRLKISEKR